jgi:hypothetical protein
VKVLTLGISRQSGDVPGFLDARPELAAKEKRRNQKEAPL